ncbi:MAG: DNA mismatch repair endonuclease MutL [Actinomycetia bacterium]|nr:DNA mismatch repair endonuclease MutL [Actinomycetes bacterium]
MSRIVRLDPRVADQIAAGEVVERPASVAKELVENALDARARRIVVQVDGGGLDQIVVEDDGEGMDAEDVRLSVERHATSKLRTVADLTRLETLGFRGEALAAIGAVGRLVVDSRPADAAIGYGVSVAGGRVTEAGPVARPPGTRVAVRDLFFTVPARLKQMKSPAAELAHVEQVVAAEALLHPGVAVELWADGARRWATPGNGELADAVAAVVGAEAAARSLPVEASILGGRVTVTGRILPPDGARGNRHGQVLGINGRPVRHAALRAAVEQAYGPALGPRRYPVFWLAVACPPEDVDPNVHPGKWEVRLDRERALAGALYGAVREVLAGGPPAPVLDPVPAAPGPLRAAERQATWVFGPASTDASPAVRHPDLAGLVPLGQWAARYVLAQGPRGLYVIDQHAAHERLYYDQLRAEAATVRYSQPLLTPLVVDLTPAEWAGFEAARSELEAAGFVFEPAGRTLRISAVPLLVADVAAGGLVGVLIQTWSGSWSEPAHPVSWIADHALATAACKAAVKASRGLAREEMAALLRDLAATDNPRACPHGRPTMLQLDLEEVDRRFGRR